MIRKGILFIPLSYNADSTKNIINIVFCDEFCNKHSLPYVDKITFLATTEFDSDILYQNSKISGTDFCQSIRKTIGDDCVEIRQRVITSYAHDVPVVIMDGVKEVGKENVIIDLTCGKKDITGSLYTTASIGQIRNMIYVDVPRINGCFPVLDRCNYEEIEQTIKLTRYESLEEIEKIASMNGMDFIYYKKNIQEIRQACDSTKIESFCTQIEHVVEEYFSGNDINYRNAIRTIGLVGEDVIGPLSNELYYKYNKDLKLTEYNHKRGLNTIAELEKIYQEKGTPDAKKTMLEPLFSKLPSIYEMFEIIRIYRNIASHYSSYKNKREEVKLLLDIIIMLLNGLIESEFANSIWEDKNAE